MPLRLPRALPRELPERVYHLAEASNWPSIERDGLLSASRLLRTSGLSAAECGRVERAHRSQHTELPSGVWLRDQRPMPPPALARCPCGLSAAEWYRTINARVFFWLDRERLERQRAACEPRQQLVMVIDAAALVAAHGAAAAVTPINTGNARRQPARRGAATFVSLAAWVASGWASEAAALGTASRPRAHRPVELTVLDGVPDIGRYLIELHPLASGQRFEPNVSSRLRRRAHRAR